MRKTRKHTATQGNTKGMGPATTVLLACTSQFSCLGKTSSSLGTLYILATNDPSRSNVPAQKLPPLL